MDVWLILGLNVGKGDWVLPEVLNHGLKLVKLRTEVLSLGEDDDADVGALGAAKGAGTALHFLFCELDEVSDFDLLRR